MITSYTIDENDYLDYQLYVASKSAQIKKKRRRSKILVPLVYAAFGLLLLFNYQVVPAGIFFLLALLWYFIYPMWERQRYIRHYRGFIRENYKDRLGRTVSLEFNNDFILAKDNGSESKILTGELEEINEIPSSIFVRLKGGQSFILPKDKIKDLNKVTKTLKVLAERLKIKYHREGEWKWK